MKINLSETEISELKKILKTKEIVNSPNFNVEILNNILNKFKIEKVVKLFVDGAADLHTKTAGIGGVFYRNGDELYSFSEHIGSATNNEAEYGALIKGLKMSIELNLLNIEIYADSELVVKQINGDYKVKNERMQKLHKEVTSLLNRFNIWKISHIPREKNAAADKLSKEAMRGKKNK